MDRVTMYDEDGMEVLSGERMTVEEVEGEKKFSNAPHVDKEVPRAENQERKSLGVKPHFPLGVLIADILAQVA